MRPKIILDNKKMSITIDRLCKQLVENHGDFEHTVVIGIQPRGVYFANRVVDRLNELYPQINLQYGHLDTSFYRDDFQRRDKPIVVRESTIDFTIEGKQVLLIDDVMYTGRTIRAAMDALLDYGRPNKVELLILIERRFSRHLPIKPDYIGKSVDTIQSQEVKVKWKALDDKDEIILLTKRSKEY